MVRPGNRPHSLRSPMALILRGGWYLHEELVIRFQTAGEHRTPERLRSHYLAERDLANQLRSASKAERQHLYATVYDELFRQVSDHPQLTRKKNAGELAEAVATRLRLLAPFLRLDSVFMEIGCGDCSLASQVARRAQHVYAVDVSAEITKGLTFPPNLELLICDGSNVPVSPGRVDVAFSYQLIEHLHPADAIDHIENVHRVLKAGGVYVCVTPNRLSGPHDISKYFETEARGFHMKEYTTWELADLFKGAGFSSSRVLFGTRGRFLLLPPAFVRPLEQLIAPLPYRTRTRLAASPIIRQLLGVAIVARK